VYNSIQKWLPFEKILDNGIIKLKNKEYIKIIKINPINYNLKSNLEKEAILNSYKLFLKTANFDFQILIQSSKENLNNHILKLKNQEKKENNKIKNIMENYIENIQKLNLNTKSDSKQFFILIKQIQEKNKEEIIIEQLNEKYFKIKESLSRCGNIVTDISSKKESLELLKKSIYLR
jgi:hypothetical protein